MQALIELLAGFIVMLATAALAQFGVSLDRAPDTRPEVRRVVDCTPSTSVAPPADAQRDC